MDGSFPIITSRLLLLLPLLLLGSNPGGGLTSPALLVVLPVVDHWFAKPSCSWQALSPACCLGVLLGKEAACKVRVQFAR